ncbi:methyltransferase domain-containing protein [Streptomyces sp. NPDC001941]|uniref:class I SAM-dependent methyltransferase n=1 Tax=Streptomyces sp. NPDC001941 TaxID=3154659 RepID=UPI00332F428F
MAMRTQDGRTAHRAAALPGARRPDERIARLVAHALGEARTVLNVGAGAGTIGGDRTTTTAIGAGAGRLPFQDAEFDAALTLLSVHQWPDTAAGLREMRRVTRGPVVVLTCDPARVRDFWLYEYAPEVLDTEARRHPRLDLLAEALGGTVTRHPVPIPLDCTDGFNEAYYGRPELLLDPASRQASPAWSFLDDRARQDFDTSLRHALGSGAWDEAFGHLRHRPTYTGSLVLLRATP